MDGPAEKLKILDNVIAPFIFILCSWLSTFIMSSKKILVNQILLSKNSTFLNS